MWFAHSAVFLAAFLLFQVELIISKVLLFKFGGTYTVWGAAVVFFQATLLLGYVYSHFVIKKIGLPRYRYLHSLLFLLTLFFFPGKPLPEIFARYNSPMVIDIFRELSRAIGPAFFALSTISIIFQCLVAKSDPAKQLNPYQLYATSNLGSFAGLLTYPFLFEFFWGINEQLTIWRILYLVLFILQIAAFKYIRLNNFSRTDNAASPPVCFKDKTYWFLLSAAGVIVFLSATNIITYEISPMPLLWIAPLCVYLISFVLNFSNKPFCPKNIKTIFFLSISFNIVIYFFIALKIIPNLLAMPCLLALIFIACMFCQNELNKNKPADTNNLTLFFVIISSGGFIGGILVSWIIPLISISMIEFFMGPMLILIALFIKENKQKLPFQKFRMLIYLSILVFIWPYVINESILLGLIFLYIIFNCLFTCFDFLLASIASLFFILLLSCGMDFLWAGKGFLTLRNYYGIYNVYAYKGVKLFVNGNVLHGAQNMDKEKEMEPLAYYDRNSPVGILLKSGKFQFLRMGYIGLGAGTLAAYAEADQTIDFFELDPDVLKIANSQFTYLKNSAGKINYFFGDARLSLQEIPDKKYDLMVIDAFSGDSVPAHLLTCEAINEYIRHTANNGIILFHISNRYFDLMPLLFSNAQMLNLYSATTGAIARVNVSRLEGISGNTVWVALTKDADSYKKICSLNWLSPEFKKIRPWTDQYSNLLAIFKYKNYFSISK